MKNLSEYRGAKPAIGILCVIAIAAFCIFSHIGYKKYTVEESYKDLFNVMESRIKNEGQVRLSQEDVNILGNAYFKNNGDFGIFKVNGVNLKINENQISFKLPIKYNELPLLLSSKGKVQQHKNDIIYTPEYFKVGIIKISNETVFSYLEGYLGDKVPIKDSKIFLNKNKLFKNNQFLKLENESIILGGKDNKYGFSKK